MVSPSINDRASGQELSEETLKSSIKEIEEFYIPYA